MMRTFIDQIPRELDEAALVDGACIWQILRRVILPLAAQGMLAVAVFVIVFAWNEFLFAFIFTTTHAKTAPLVIGEMIGARRGRRLGRAVRRLDRAAAADARLRLPAALPHRRPDRGRGQGIEW